jgi:hypothetical protein
MDEKLPEAPDKAEALTVSPSLAVVLGGVPFRWFSGEKQGHSV